MCHFIVRSSPHIPLRHLVAASLVGLHNYQQSQMGSGTPV